MKKFFSYLGSLLAIASLVFVGYSIAQHIHELPEFRADAGTVLVLAGVLALFVFTTYCMSYTWVILLRRGGVDLSLREAYCMIGKSQIGKYFPGNVLHFVGRVALGKQRGIPTETLVISIGMETALAAFSAAVLSLIGYLAGFIGIPWIGSLLEQRNITIPQSGIIAGVVVLVFLILTSREARTWLRMRAVYVHGETIATVMLIYTVVLMVNGGILHLILDSVWNVQSPVTWYELSFGFSLAWLLGFIVPGAPGGIGIREAVFVGLFGSQLGEGVAVGLAVVLRVITTVSDVVTFGIAAWLGRRGTITP